MECPHLNRRIIFHPSRFITTPQRLFLGLKIIRTTLLLIHSNLCIKVGLGYEAMSLLWWDVEQGESQGNFILSCIWNTSGHVMNDCCVF